jgi:hypothetical protein
METLMVFFKRFIFYAIGGGGAHIRGLLVVLLAGIFACSFRYRRARLALWVAMVIIGLSALSVAQQLVRSPAAPLFGVTAQAPEDFVTNYSGALELHQQGGSPYGIEEKYHLQAASVSFPFPTYALYWAAAGFGHWGQTAAGVVFTGLNLAAALALIWASFKLSGGDYGRLTRLDRWWLLLSLSFVVLNSRLWDGILIGQTPGVAACFAALGFWLARTGLLHRDLLAGMLLTLAIMIKPNFSPLLLYLPISWVREHNSSPQQRLAAHPLGVFFCSCFLAVSFVFLSMSLFHIRWPVYVEFVSKIIPILDHEVAVNFNISLLGLFNNLLGIPAPSKIATLVLLGAAVAYGWRGKFVSWYAWLAISLLISPITWGMYAALLLPAQFAISWCAVKTRNGLALALLLVSTGLLDLRYSLPGFIGIALVLFLALWMSDRLPNQGGISLIGG